MESGLEQKILKFFDKIFAFSYIQKVLHKTWRVYLNSKGFTLAEVLVTLAVIGIVAALTIPSLVKSYQNKTYVNGMKKAYSALNQAVKKMAIDAGTPGDLGASGIFTNYIIAGDALAAQFKVAKNCGKSTDQDCWAIYNNYYDGTGTENDLNIAGWRYKFITTDGMSISLMSFNNNCTSDYGVNSDSPTTKTCGIIHVDINAKKAPNYGGKDVFLFYVTSNKSPLIYPRGGKEDNKDKAGVIEGDNYWNYNNTNKCSNTNKSSSYCTGRVIEKGYTIDY